MNNCDHQFIAVLNSELLQGEKTCVCAYCGQVRILFPNGNVIIVKESGQVTQMKNAD